MIYAACIALTVSAAQAQGDMARILPEYGTDPDVRAFAEGVLAAQEAEIAWMTDWLAANGTPAE